MRIKYIRVKLYHSYGYVRAVIGYTLIISNKVVEYKSLVKCAVAGLDTVYMACPKVITQVVYNFF